MKKMSKLLALTLVIACLCTLIVPVSAVNVVKVIDAGEFGTLTGTLYDSYALIDQSVEGNELFFYDFSYRTTLARSPADWATIHSHVELYNKSTGAYLDYDACVETCEDGNLTGGYYYELDRVPGIRGENGITVSAFGCHEVRYYDSYVAYTKKTYNLQRDHGIT